VNHHARNVRLPVERARVSKEFWGRSQTGKRERDRKLHDPAD
jgi:hypothetical protein